MSKNDKPQDRIVSSRGSWGKKITKGAIRWDKIQVVEFSESRLILNVESIAGNEGNGEALVELVQGIMDEHRLKPQEVVADSAYGSGENREALPAHAWLLLSPT